MFKPRASNGEEEVPRTVISRLRSPDGRGTARMPSMVPPVAYSGTDTPSSRPLSSTVALLECFTKWLGVPLSAPCCVSILPYVELAWVSLARRTGLSGGRRGDTTGIAFVVEGSELVAVFGRDGELELRCGCGGVGGGVATSGAPSSSGSGLGSSHAWTSARVIDLTCWMPANGCRSMMAGAEC